MPYPHTTLEGLQTSLEVFEELVRKAALTSSRHLSKYQKLVEINKAEIKKLETAND